METTSAKTRPPGCVCEVLLSQAEVDAIVEIAGSMCGDYLSADPAEFLIECSVRAQELPGAAAP